MKHKHADLIHAWADGAEIQFRSEACEWHDCLGTPIWGSKTCEYRIKPEEKKPVVRWLWAYKTMMGWKVTDILYSDELSPEGWVKLEWSRTEFPE